MKKLILLFVTSILLISCTAEPLPVNLNNSKIGKYNIMWNSNQGNPSMSIKILHQGEAILDLNHITTHTYDIILNNDDIIIININYKTAITNPQTYLSIYKYNSIDLSSGVYNPSKMELIYEQESNTNTFSFNGDMKSLNK